MLFFSFLRKLRKLSRGLTNDTTEFLIKSRTRVRIFNPLFFLILSHCVYAGHSIHIHLTSCDSFALSLPRLFIREFYPTAINLSVHLIIAAYYYEHNSHKCMWMTTTLRWLSESAKVRLLCAIHNLMIDDCCLWNERKEKKLVNFCFFRGFTFTIRVNVVFRLSEMWVRCNTHFSPMLIANSCSRRRTTKSKQTNCVPAPAR